uniref:Uncharacterized protein n=1 Tax=Setaria digitata TaxID=48799 RepID=A0A915PWP2_9BILA
MFENDEKKEENEEGFVKGNKLRESTAFPHTTSSAMAPIYKRNEFMVLSGGVAIYWIVTIFIGTLLTMCCICKRSHYNEDEDEDEEPQKRKTKKKEDGDLYH